MGTETEVSTVNVVKQDEEVPELAIERATTLAIDRRVISPAITQELKSTGVAQVVVYLRTNAAAAEDDPAAPLREIFVNSRLSRAYALRQVDSSLSGRQRAALAEETPSSDVMVFPNLGLLVGTVDTDGLTELQQHEQVAIVTGSPQFSLIRPEITGAALAEDAAWGAERIGVTRLWKGGLSGKDILVGHCDTGVDDAHAALKGAVARFTDTDSLGKLTSSKAYDSGLHGTHTAGIIAGRLKSIGMAPGCQLASAIVIEGGDPIRRILAGLDWVVGLGVRVINMSFGLRGYQDDFQPLIDLIRSKNILPVVAVGNEGPGTSRSPGNYANVLSVGAVDSDLNVWDQSSSQRLIRKDDPVVPDLVAPGVAVLSAKAGGTYFQLNGTSMATPHIAGLAALLFEAKPGATAEQVESAILASCTLPAGMSADRGNRGFPNAGEALKALTGTALGDALPKSRKAPAPRKRRAVARKAPAGRGKGQRRVAKRATGRTRKTRKNPKD